MYMGKWMQIQSVESNQQWCWQHFKYHFPQLKIEFSANFERISFLLSLVLTRLHFCTRLFTLRIYIFQQLCRFPQHCTRLSNLSCCQFFFLFALYLSFAFFSPPSLSLASHRVFTAISCNELSKLTQVSWQHLS